jgi:hypothetical protein
MYILATNLIIFLLDRYILLKLLKSRSTTEHKPTQFKSISWQCQQLSSIKIVISAGRVYAQASESSLFSYF